MSEQSADQSAANAFTPAAWSELHPPSFDKDVPQVVGLAFTDAQGDRHGFGLALDNARKLHRALSTLLAEFRFDGMRGLNIVKEAYLDDASPTGFRHGRWYYKPAPGPEVSDAG